MTSLDFWLGLGLGLGVSVAVLVGLRWYFRRAIQQRSATASARRSVRAATSAPEPATPMPLSVSVAPIRPNGSAAGNPGNGGISATEAELLPTPERHRPSPSPNVLDEGPVRLSQRILLHLARNGGPSAGGTASEAVTQRGIGTALVVTQGALSSVLRRLEDGGAIASEKAHVRDRERRVKIYVLTPRGREVVAALRQSAVARRGVSVAAPEAPPKRPPSPSR